MNVSRDPVSIDLKLGWNLISLPFPPANPAINSVVNADHPVDIVMAYDNEKEEWLASRRSAYTGLFEGDVTVMTADTAYFIRTNISQELTLLRPPLAITAETPPPLPIIYVGEGWNLVPVLCHKFPPPNFIWADDYFRTLGADGWLKALTFNPEEGAWESMGPQSRGEVTIGKGYWLYATKAGMIIP